MKTKILSFIGMIFCVMALGGAEISAYSPEEMFVIDNGNIGFNDGYKGDCKVIDIPPEINGQKVTSINPYGFSFYEGVEKVIIPEGVNQIGSSAFMGMYDLKEVNIPASVAELEYNPFSNCPELKNIIIDENNKNMVADGSLIYSYDRKRLLSGSGFSGNFKLPETVEVIDMFAFSGNKYMTSVDFGDTKMSIESFPFTDAGSIKEFKGSGNYSYKISDGMVLSADGSVLIMVPTALKEVNIPDGVQEIGHHAFLHNADLESVNIPDGVEKISRGAFMNCISLKNVNLPDSVKEIESDSFSDCESLEKLHMSKNIENIGTSTFDRCFALEEIDIPEGNLNYKFENKSLIGKKEGNLIFAPYSEEKYIIPDGVKKIEEYAFGYNFIIKEITIPSSAESIEQFAFAACENLKKINFSQELKRIEMCAFIDCHSIKSVKLPDSLEYIGTGAFSNCRSLAKVEISPDTEQGTAVFAYTPYNGDAVEPPVTEATEESVTEETSAENNQNDAVDADEEEEKPEKNDINSFSTALIIIGVVVLAVIIVVIVLVVLKDNKNKYENNQQ